MVAARVAVVAAAAGVACVVKAALGVYLPSAREKLSVWARRGFTLGTAFGWTRGGGQLAVRTSARVGIQSLLALTRMVVVVCWTGGSPMMTSPPVRSPCTCLLAWYCAGAV